VPKSRSLPLINPPSDIPQWEGLRPAAQLTMASRPPEPEFPQGEYLAASGGRQPAEGPGILQEIDISRADSGPRRADAHRSPSPDNRVELLAPAGGPEAGFAAFHFGADAIYLGLKKFSARAEAENFTLEEVSEITAYAHSLSPRRRVFVTINTLIRQDELPELIEALAHLTALGVDAIIVQDLGVYYAIRSHFPSLELHASTQLAVHNRAGAEALRRLGFERVVLARELTFEEVDAITGAGDVETEVFIHGALCYSYSGLCLFSAQTLGRSGNRGKCSYSCRDDFEVTGAPLTLRDGTDVRRDPRHGFPFSMKDLALPDHLPSLRASGVSCFKIEGRKKSPLYVATTTDYYRRLLDGRLSDAERPVREADLQTVFSRPWTGLFLNSHKDKEVADRDTVGHRGTAIGRVEEIIELPRERRVRFRTSRALQKHDGIQIDLPTQGKPFGFPVDHLWQLPGGRRKPQDSLTVPAGSLVEVALPREAPAIPVGSPVYCSSSQEVKQRYKFHRPKPGLYAVRRPVEMDIVLSLEEAVVTARTYEAPWAVTPVEVRQTLTGPFAATRDAAKMDAALRDAFARLGGSRFELASIAVHNDAGAFVPVSRLNPLRRQMIADLETALDRAREAFLVELKTASGGRQPSEGKRIGNEELFFQTGNRPWVGKRPPLAWSLKVDRIDFLDAFEAGEFRDVDEITIDIARDHPSLLREKLAELSNSIGGDRIRLALPPLTRAWEERGLLHKIESLRNDGWTNWEIGNASGWSYLGLDPAATHTGSLDVSADWSLYVLNRLAARQLLGMGLSKFTLSPEDGFANSRSLWFEFGPQAVLIVHQDTPLFLAESCAYANLIGGCPGKANCSFESMEMESSHGEKVTALDHHCRTIVLNRGPYCLSPRLGELVKAGARSLRADFIYRKYDAAEVRDVWRLIRAGKAVPGGHAANWERGLQ
jgi:putative protease